MKSIEDVTDASRIYFDDFEVAVKGYSVEPMYDENAIVFSKDNEHLVVNLNAVKIVRFANLNSVLDFFL